MTVASGLLQRGGGILLFLICFVMTGESYAADQDPHQHGQGELNVIVDGHELALEVRLPAADVVGFEHLPNNDQQTGFVEQVLAGFESGEHWFEPSAEAACELESVQASLAGMSVSMAAEQTEAHGHHSDFDGFLLYLCGNPEALVSVKVLFFEFFADVSALNVQLVAPVFQTSLRLTPDDPVLMLSR